MIVQLTGTLVEVTPSRVTLDVGGVGYELGVPMECLVKPSPSVLW